MKIVELIERSLTAQVSRIRVTSRIEYAVKTKLKCAVPFALHKYSYVLYNDDKF